MQLSVRLFARARDLAGMSEVVVELSPGATVADLRRHLSVDYPALKSLLENSALAVNDEFADDSLSLSPNSEIALLPPVSGGSHWEEKHGAVDARTH
jgi:molybdopterin converting factor subunit 1